MDAPKDFPWREGMRVTTTNGYHFRLYMGEGGILIGQGEGGAGYLPGWTADLAQMVGADPDPTDGATIGALAAAVREAYPDWFAVCCQYRGSVEEWNVVGRHQSREMRHSHAIIGAGPTEFAAWLAAWNARPKDKA